MEITRHTDHRVNPLMMLKTYHLGPFSIKLLGEIPLLTQDHVEVLLARDPYLETPDRFDIGQASRHL